MEIKKKDKFPPEVKGKGPVDWDAMSSSHFAWGIVFMVISAVLLVLFFVELFVGLIVPFEFFDKYVLCVLLLSITLTGASGITTIYFSHYCGDNFAINGFIIILATTIPCAALNVSLFVWMMANTFSPPALVNLLLSIFVSLSAFLLGYDMYIAHIDKESYVLYVQKGKETYFLKWNAKLECMEFILSTQEEESMATTAKNIEIVTEERLVIQEKEKQIVKVKEIETREEEPGEEGVDERAGKRQAEAQQEEKPDEKNEEEFLKEPEEKHVEKFLKEPEREKEPEFVQENETEKERVSEPKSDRGSALGRLSNKSKEGKKEEKKLDLHYHRLPRKKLLQS